MSFNMPHLSLNSLYDPFGSPCRGQKPQGREGCSWRSDSARVLVSATESLRQSLFGWLRSA